MTLDPAQLHRAQQELQRKARQLPEYQRLMQRRYREPKGYSKTSEVLERICCGMQPWTQDYRINPEADFAGAMACELALPFCTAVPAPPIYWISQELLEALLKTDIRGDAVSNLPIPHFTMVLMLPKGAIASPDNDPVDYLLWQHREAGQSYTTTYRGKVIDSKTGGTPDDVQSLLWSTYLPSGVAYGSYTGLSAEHFDDQPFDIDTPEAIEVLNKQNIVETEQAFQQKLTSLIVQVICLLTAQPDLLDLNVTEQKAAKLSKRKARALHNSNRLLSPNWIGRDYRRPKGLSQNSSHASPIAHYRRGHWRLQAFGEERKQHKLLWIQPTIVSPRIDN